ncbi:hypothetical protein B7R78_0021895 [Ralstonia solanacearum]|uniref:Uncharacterized protein n=1 Tax=Ralstonia solanacearum K60 TaxID=1091042 RepID=A0AAP7ZHV0_RALSL|nr:hypothetical protein [Ralstonia solanacearum]MBT1539632.1 hypothetical protein [Ralstonia solanacearum]OYQ09382.1 hypothetical protein B7R77_20885 [Ralstonia solanacearum K60]QOK84166.1 hypothetical protein HF906_18740 [Ralstonia solanacearum]RIJ84674.1 hypothetical protein RSP822_20010 [Ralstonia solanacearum]
MSANKSDEALQRLNYFNGQRLAAADFRAEQGHHVGMRHVLNRSLYSPGIVVGLEVVPVGSNDPQDKHHVIVKRGLAFDNLGREIFLPVDVKVQVMGAPRSAPGVVFGNLLVVSYGETRQFPTQSRCTIGAPFRPCSGDLAWGAPTRIVADAIFEFVDSWPSEDSGKIVLSQIELDEKCNVVRTSPGVRRYAVPAKPQTVRPVSLEGEKDIDRQNGKSLYFHIDGGAPESAVLYLRGLPFSSLYYTELGKHIHHIDFASETVHHDFGHSHTVTGGGTDEQGEHTHSFIVDNGETSGGIDVNDTNNNFVTGANPIQPAGKHTHALVGVTFSKELGDWGHSHRVQGDTQGTGASDLDARNGKPALKLLKDLIVRFDGVSITGAICDQLEARAGQGGQWRVMGGGGVDDVRLNGATLSKPPGTGEIDLLKLGIEIGIGQHKLEFVVSDPDVGGQIQYNLYVS